MVSFLKTASAIFAAGVVCGAGALSGLAPTSPNGTTEPAIARPDARPESSAVVATATVPCWQQVWPIIDRRCMRLAAEGWTDRKADPNSGAGSSGAVNAEPPAARAAEAAQAVSQAGRPAPESSSPPVESHSVARPTTTTAHQGTRAKAKLSQQAQHRNKAPRKSQVARSRNHNGDYRDQWDRRDYSYRAYRDDGYRERGRTIGGWRDDAGSEFVTGRRLIMRR
jgi:hypothetical protein